MALQERSKTARRDKNVSPAIHRPGLDEVARMEAAVAKLKPALAKYAREHSGRYILFGSAARREMRPGSDVDIVVEFPPETEREAMRFAEDACWDLGLKPDIQWLGAPDGRFRARVEAEGLILPGDEERWSRPMSKEDRWGDIFDAAKSATKHFLAAGRIFQSGGMEDPGDFGYERRMAFYHAMQSGHTALESGFKRVLPAVGELPPTGSEWHKALVQRLAQPSGPRKRPLLDAELAAAADKTREARHFSTHAYDVPFDAEKARVGLEAGLVIAQRIEAALVSFAQDTDSAN